MMSRWTICCNTKKIAFWLRTVFIYFVWFSQWTEISFLTPHSVLCEVAAGSFVHIRVHSTVTDPLQPVERHSVNAAAQIHCSQWNDTVLCRCTDPLQSVEWHSAMQMHRSTAVSGMTQCCADAQTHCSKWNDTVLCSCTDPLQSVEWHSAMQLHRPTAVSGMTQCYADAQTHCSQWNDTVLCRCTDPLQSVEWHSAVQMHRPTVELHCIIVFSAKLDSR